MWWIIVLAFLFLLLISLLILPLEVLLDTQNNVYRIRNIVVFSIRYIPGDDLGKLGIRILFVPFKLRVTKIIQRIGKETVKEPKARKTKKVSRNNRRTVKWSFEKVKRIIRAVSVKRLHAQLDTGNFPLNARLIPVTTQLSNSDKIDLNINFDGNNHLFLKIHQIPIQLIIAILKK